MKKKQQKALSRAEKAIKFIEFFCRVPEGKFVGKPLILDEFQKKFIRAIFNENLPKPVKTAIWSMARKNSKTTTIACLVLVFLVGPEASLNSQIVSGAMSREQAALVFNQCCKIIRMSPELEGVIRIIPSAKKLIGLPMNTEYKALSAEGKTAMGLSPKIVIFDELGQVVGPKSEFFESLTTAQGAHENPLLIIISTQAPTDADLLSILIDDALKSEDPSIVCHLYAAKEDCDLMDEKAWRDANPAIGKFRSLDDVRIQAEKAVRMPSFEPVFRNLILNQRVVSTSPLITSRQWKEIGSDYSYQLLYECENVYFGIDLSAKNDLTSCVFIGEYKDKHLIFPFFWTPNDTIHDRARRDGAPYDIWANQGHLEVIDGSSIDYDVIAVKIATICSKIKNLKKGAFDRWRIDVMKAAFERAGFDAELEPWGQGFKDMGLAVDEIETLILNKQINHNNNPVMNMCATNSIVVKDPAGNRKLDKSKTSKKIDGMVAATMAIGLKKRDSDNSGSFNDFINSPIIV